MTCRLKYKVVLMLDCCGLLWYIEILKYLLKRCQRVCVELKVEYEIYICEAVCEAVRKKTTGTKESRDSPLTFKQHFFDVPTKSELTRPSADCQTTVFRGIKQLKEFLKKVAERSRDSGWGHSTVGRLSNNVFGCFKQLEFFLQKVTERSRDSGRRSRDHRPTVKQRFFDVSSK